MGIQFPLHSMTVWDHTSRYYEAELGETNDKEQEMLEEELRAGKIKFSDLMRDGISSQLHTIISKRDRSFTNEMLGHPDLEGKKILDIRA